MFMGGRDTYDYEKLTDEEVDAIHLAFDKGLKRIENVSPKLAANMRPQREAYVKWAGIAKATFPETKSFSYPAVAGGLGVDWITPELYNYDTNATITHYNSTASAYTSFDLTLTAGTARYIAGQSTSAYYTGSSTSDKHSFVVIAQDGLVEVGTTPKCDMLKFFTQLQTKYQYIAMNPLLTQSIEDYRQLYQYNTPGMIPMDHNVGTCIAVMPQTTGLSTIVPLGLVFYEYDFATTIPRTTSTP